MAPRRLNLPETASVALDGEDGRLFAPSAARNVVPITRALANLVPQTGTAIEIASGTGEQVLHYGQAYPNLTWHPTDVDPRRAASIKAWVDQSGLTNIAEPVVLDATDEG